MAYLSPEEGLNEESYSYEFFQAVRLLERLNPEKKRVGGEAMPHEEIVRFRSRVALEFPASEIHEMRKVIDETGQSERLEMLVNFMGVVGVSGALPTHYTELVLDRIRHRDTTMWAFFDIFTHRIVSLFYRAWAKYRYPITYEAGDESFTAYLYDLAGLGTRGLRGRMAVEDEALLPYTGLIAQAPHTADALANMISDHFSAKAKIEQFSGQWLLLDGRDVTQLGAKNSSLGRSAIVGTRVWDQQSKFRVRLGPLDLKRFQAFLPSGSAHEPLKSIVKFMVGDELDFDVQLVLEAKQVPATILTTRAIRRPALGWTSFLKTKPFKKPDDQVVLKMAA
ncbi:MAG: type VI secretion protein [Acidobacteria bacterium OLB17]|nr:MAG: type VI secretion protein [Acidobacteria bacterium OLB17]MCZ2391025.1 type VI secretion system baseplate subunit TssG [Acidobacteriota bacterium]